VWHDLCSPLVYTDGPSAGALDAAAACSHLGRSWSSRRTCRDTLGSLTPSELVTVGGTATSDDDGNDDDERVQPFKLVFMPLLAALSTPPAGVHANV